MNPIKTIVNVKTNGHGVISRRGFVGSLATGFGLAGMGWTDLMAASANDLRNRKMSVIVLWMQGGPSQFETFDPKPGHKNGMETKAIQTAVPGIQIAEGWDKTAAMMKDIALIRSMTSKEGNHQRATYAIHTGYVPTGTVKHPSFGSLCAAELGEKEFDLPQIVAVGGQQVSGAGAGFLGVAYEPFAVENPLEMPSNMESPVDPARFNRRLNILGSLEKAGFGKNAGADRVREHQSLYKQTAGMVLSPRVRAFDLTSEPSELRDAYGRNPFGQGCLLARRLVEQGVTFIEVRSNGWDMHRGLKETMSTNASQVDPAFATLIQDLKQRGMLESTLVVWMGEFGRTPKINPNGGRDHYPRAFNVAAAGGGVKGGQVIGKTSDDGSAVTDSPVSIQDLLRTFCKTLNINPAKENVSPQGRPLKIVDGGKIVTSLLA
ncbi:MAG: DUF1501 domain-containing protein [Planctomycetota bacterium]